MKRVAYTGKNVKASGPYSHVVEANGFFYFSGQTAYNGLENTESKLNITKQTVACFDNLLDVMKEVEITFDNVVKVNVYLTDMSYFDEMNSVYETMFKTPFPARTCVAVKALPLGADIEIECIAVKSSN